MRILAIVIPKPGTEPERRIARGSAILCADNVAAEHNTYYFEGNVASHVTLHAFKNRAIVAAHRLLEDRPTIARGRWPGIDFSVVARLHIEENGGRPNRFSLEIEDQEALDGWCDALQEFPSENV